MILSTSDPRNSISPHLYLNLSHTSVTNPHTHHRISSVHFNTFFFTPPHIFSASIPISYTSISLFPKPNSPLHLHLEERERERMEECEKARKKVRGEREETSSGTVSMAKRRRISSERENCFELLHSTELELKEETSSSVSGKPPDMASSGSGEVVTETNGVEEEVEKDRRFVLSRMSSSGSNNNILKNEIPKVVDSKVMRSDTVTETSTSIFNTNSRENTNNAKLRLEMEKKAPVNVVARRMSSPGVRMPPESEIEEFFSAAEKYEQKRFADKYNYDIVKDEPLEGRYQWMRLK